MCNYLGKYDQHLRDTASNHMENLQNKLEGNLSQWNEEMKQKSEFEEKLLQEYRNSTTWYQHEIQHLQGQKSEKEASLEQLRVEFLKERQKLNDKHKDELSVKATEHTRLSEKQRRRQEQLVHWYSRKLDEKDEKWQATLASVQEKNMHLVHERNEERVAYQKEAQNADEQIQNLTTNLTKLKYDFDAISKLN